jgi:hypothetical protein
MSMVFPTLLLPAALFLVANVILLLLILVLNQRESSNPAQSQTPAQENPAGRLLQASDVLGWEFEYARVTASESMQDRHTMVNFYLIATGVIASGVIGVLGKESSLPPAVGTALLWVLCGIGWLYFLKIIRLRQAWHDSARAMNQIKDFYIKNSDKFAPDLLRTAFRWTPGSLPPPDKRWTVFFYSAVLIGFLNSVAYMAGAALLDREAALQHSWLAIALLILLGLLFFAFHVWLYFEFLRPKEATGGHGTHDPHQA